MTTLSRTTNMSDINSTEFTKDESVMNTMNEFDTLAYSVEDRYAVEGIITVHGTNTRHGHWLSSMRTLTQNSFVGFENYHRIDAK